MGNHALARGAFEAGVKVAAGYPGTPSTEILEALAQYPGVHVQWSPNEKVALEVAAGASLAGARALATMKHVGVNVAADPLMTLSYTGVNGGLVLVTADDPGLFSSQNGQDNRFYARFAQVPCLEPSDSQEIRDMVLEAFKLSEDYDTPVILRLTTRTAHGYSPVEWGGSPQEAPLKGYEKRPSKYVMLPAFSRERHLWVDKRRRYLEAYAEGTPWNRVEWRDLRVGMITGGVAYHYVREGLPGVSTLKLGLSYPLPFHLIRNFVRAVKCCYVVEELEPFWEEQIRAWGLSVAGKEILPRTGELDPLTLAQSLGSLIGEEFPELVNRELLEMEVSPEKNLPNRPPLMCPGCPHRGVFYVLNKMNLTVMGDIGCYTLGALPPLEAMDTCLCMGASLGMAHGMEKARGREFARRSVAVIGDSTFWHTGLSGLLDMVYNKSQGTVIILDNGTTAVTGHQPHPGTGFTLRGEPAPRADLERAVRGLGVEWVRVVDSYDLGSIKKNLEEALKEDKLAVIIARRPCVLLEKRENIPFSVGKEECVGCGLCLQLGCPALHLQGGESPNRPSPLYGMLSVRPVCPRGAIKRKEREWM